MYNNILKNSNSHLINNKQKIKSLKDNHFIKFLNNLTANPYYNYMSNNNIQKANKIKLDNSSLKTYNKEINKDNTNEPNYKIREFKSPKYLNYHFKFKAPQFKNIKIDDTNTEINKNNNIIFNYKSYFKQRNTSHFLKYNKIDFNDFNYDPNKISNNFINFNTDKECSKTPQKKEKIKIKININEYQEKNKKSKTNYKHNSIREGYFGRKENMGIPYLFDTYTIFSNKYSNKSEKCRHEMILNDLHKLKGFLKGNPKNKISIFKDFLKKYNISNIEQFSDDKILKICNILCSNDNDILIHFLKPYLNTKDMVLDLINNLSLLKQNKKNTDINNKNNNNNIMKPINYNFNNNKDNIYLKQNSSSELLNNINDDLLFKTKINNKNEHTKDSRNIKYNINDKISSNNNTKDFFSKTENSFYNQKAMSIYQSPFFIAPKSHHIFLYPQNKPNINISSKKKLDLSETNSLLKNLNYQTKALGPTKEYSLNNDLLINDISKEMRELENNYNRVLISNKDEDYKSKTQNKFNIFKKKSLYHSPTTMNYIKKDFKIRPKDIFSKTSIQFYDKNKNITNQKNNRINFHIISLNIDKNDDKLKKSNSNTEPCFKRKRNKKLKSLNEINIRMYYKPIKYKFGYKQIKDQYKITECAALNFAKKKKYDPMSLICNL